jgi:branched-chain amino acid transport system substrate-binding protein
MTLIVVVAVILLTMLPIGAAGQETVRIGFTGPLSGVLAPSGKDMSEGFQLGFEQAGNQCGRRKVELIVEDNEGNPNMALSKVRKLIERDHIKVLGGVQWSHIAYAVAGVADKERLPFLVMSTPDDITKRKPAKFTIRVSAAASQIMHPLADYSRKTLGFKRMAAIALDNAFGHESIGGFQKVFEDGGGEVVQKLWVPINALDFAPYLSQIRRDVDAVVSTFAGGGAQRFIKQYAEYGLKGRLPLVASGVQQDEAVIRSLGDEAVGIIGSLYWSPTIENAATAAFVKNFVAKYDKTPSVYHMSLYSGARWVCEALKATEGKGDDPEQLLAAIRRAAETVEDPRGPIKLDEYGNPTQNFYIFRVEKGKDGKLLNRVIHSYPMVSQFWTYRPADFLKLPAYSRDYPPMKP